MAADLVVAGVRVGLWLVDAYAQHHRMTRVEALEDLGRRGTSFIRSLDQGSGLAEFYDGDMRRHAVRGQDMETHAVAESGQGRAVTSVEVLPDGRYLVTSAATAAYELAMPKQPEAGRR